MVFGLNKIGCRLQGNRRWQTVVLLEEELYHLSILTAFFPKALCYCTITGKMWDISPKELQKEQDDVIKSPKTKSFSFR